MEEAQAPLLETSSTHLGTESSHGAPPPQRAKTSFTSLARAAWNNGVLCMITSTLLFASVGLAVRELSRTNLPVLQVICSRGLFGVVVTFIASKVLRISPLYGKRESWGLLLGRGVFGASSMILYFTGFYLLPLGDASALQQLSTVFAPSISWALRCERSSWIILLGSVVCTFGAVIVCKPPFLFGGHDEWTHSREVGIFASLIAAVLASLAYLVMGRLGKSNSTLTLTMWFHSASFLIPIIPLAFSFPAPPITHFTLDEGLWLAVVSALGVVSQLVLSRGYQLCNATKGTAIQSTVVVYSYILGFIVLGEEVSWLAVGGTALIIVGIVILAEGKRRIKVQELESLVGEEAAEKA